MVGIEIQSDVCEMANRSILYNNLQEKYKIINGDIKKLDSIITKESFDAVVTNPPYKKENSGVTNIDESKLISRHEIMCSLEDVIKAAFFALKEKGSLYMIHRPERIVDIMCTMRKYRIEPKTMRLIIPKPKEKPNLVLIKGIKYGNSFLQVPNPLIIYNQDGTYTEELKDIYGINMEEI